MVVVVVDAKNAWVKPSATYVLCIANSFLQSFNLKDKIIGFLLCIVVDMDTNFAIFNTHAKMGAEHYSQS